MKKQNKPVALIMMTERRVKVKAKVKARERVQVRVQVRVKVKARVKALITVVRKPNQRRARRKQ